MIINQQTFLLKRRKRVIQKNRTLYLNKQRAMYKSELGNRMQSIQICDMLSKVFCGTEEKTNYVYRLVSEVTAN